MRVAFALCAIGLGLLDCGCSLVAQGTSTLAYRTRAWLDDCAEGKRDRQWADAAWQRVRGAEPAQAYSDDYSQGFKDGFVHALYQGGSGEPPPLPPRSYRALRYQTPEGYKAIEDWFAGYRHGAAVVEQQGYRHWVTGPTSLRLPGEPDVPVPPVVEGAAPMPEAQADVPRPKTIHILRAREPVIPPPEPPVLDPGPPAPQGVGGPAVEMLAPVAIPSREGVTAPPVMWRKVGPATE